MERVVLGPALLLLCLCPYAFPCPLSCSLLVSFHPYQGLLTGLTSAVTMRKAGIEAAATQWKSIINGRLAEAEQDVLRWSSVVGLDPSYLRRELEMMDTLRTGDALMHHLEPAYFGAMRRVLEEGAVVDMGGEKDPLDA